MSSLEQLRRGVLTITLPKHAQRRRINISSD